MQVDIKYSKDPTRVIARKASDESVTSSTTLQNDNDLLFAIGANETWTVDFLIHATFSAVGQAKVAVNAPSGATVRTSATLVPDAIVPGFGSSGSIAGAISLVSALAVAGAIRITATIVNGATAGNVTLQWAQNVSDGTATTFLANSSMVANKI